MKKELIDIPDKEIKIVKPILTNYVVQIKVNNKCMNLGYYNTAEEASKAYEEARLKYHGTFLNKCKVING